MEAKVAAEQVARGARAVAVQVAALQAVAGPAEDSEVSVEAEDEVVPWFSAAAGADSTSIGRMVRSTTPSAIPRWTPRLTL